MEVLIVNKNNFKSIKGTATAGQIKRGLMMLNVTEVELS